MKKYDIIFIHPPRVMRPYNNKSSKYARSSYIFIPLGVFSLGDFLEKNGFEVKIINYPLEQYLDHKWSLYDYLKTIDFDFCGIDLHWIHNAHGAIEIAKIVKTIKPNVKVLLGGYSATYYHKEILKYFNQIDGIIRGEGEIPLLKYLKAINQNQSLDSVPNLSYRNSSNHIKINPISYIAKSLDDLNFSNMALLKNANHYLECSRKIMGISYNVSMGRACPFNCPFCGGGQRAQYILTKRNKVLLRSPEKIVDDISVILNKYNIDSVFFGHGTYPANLKYWKKLFGLIQKEKFDIGGDLEIWRLPFPKEMWKIFHKTFIRKNSSISISPRTLSNHVQQKIRKVCDPTFNFPENQIKDLIKNANLFQRTLRIWLTMGFPFQTRFDVFKDFSFGVKCLLKYGRSKFKPITIMNEFYHVFPGSPAYESPDSFEIKLKKNSFLEIAESFKQSKDSFFYNVINYETKHFSEAYIRKVNMLLFLSTAPLLFSTSPHISQEKSKKV